MTRGSGPVNVWKLEVFHSGCQTDCMDVIKDDSKLNGLCVCVSVSGHEEAGNGTSLGTDMTVQ